MIVFHIRLLKIKPFIRKGFFIICFRFSKVIQRFVRYKEINEENFYDTEGESYESFKENFQKGSGIPELIVT